MATADRERRRASDIRDELREARAVIAALAARHDEHGEPCWCADGVDLSDVGHADYCLAAKKCIAPPDWRWREFFVAADPNRRREPRRSGHPAPENVKRPTKPPPKRKDALRSVTPVEPRRRAPLSEEALEEWLWQAYQAGATRCDRIFSVAIVRRAFDDWLEDALQEAAADAR